MKKKKKTEKRVVKKGRPQKEKKNGTVICYAYAYKSEIEMGEKTQGVFKVKHNKCNALFDDVATLQKEKET